MLCGACLADNESGREACARCGEPLPPAPSGPEVGTTHDDAAAKRPLPKAVLPEAGEAGHNRRTHPRREIPIEFRLQRLDAAGDVVEEEVVVAENISRGGARLKTSLRTLRERDLVAVEEVGGEFRTRASVRHVYVGRDRVRRLNLQFLDRPAPDRLAGSGAVGGSTGLMQRLARIVVGGGDPSEQ